MAWLSTLAAWTRVGAAASELSALAADLAAAAMLSWFCSEIVYEFNVADRLRNVSAASAACDRLLFDVDVVVVGGLMFVFSTFVVVCGGGG